MEPRYISNTDVSVYWIQDPTIENPASRSSTITSAATAEVAVAVGTTVAVLVAVGGSGVSVAVGVSVDVLLGVGVLVETCTHLIASAITKPSALFEVATDPPLPALNGYVPKLTHPPLVGALVRSRVSGVAPALWLIVNGWLVAPVPTAIRSSQAKTS